MLWSPILSKLTDRVSLTLLIDYLLLKPGKVSNLISDSALTLPDLVDILLSVLDHLEKTLRSQQLFAIHYLHLPYDVVGHLLIIFLEGG